MSVLCPARLDEALDLLTAHPEATPIAGGTDLCVHWPGQLDAGRRTWLDLTGVSELRGHRWEDHELALGALCTYWDIIEDPRAAVALPLLREAARQVGAVQIQTRGTWAGNVMNASPAADGVLALMAYDAAVVLRSGEGAETVPLSDFYTGYKEMRRQSDQLLTEIRVPLRSYDFEWFEKVGTRAAQAISKVGAAATRRGSEWRVVANSVAPTVRRCPSLEAFLQTGGRASGPEDLISLLRRDVSPIDDIRSTARYREQVLARLLYFGLRAECPSFT